MKKRHYLVKFRREAGLTQVDAAKKLKLTRPYYVSIETANAQPSIELWLKIQRAFNIHDDDMWKVITHLKEEDFTNGKEKN